MGADQKSWRSEVHEDYEEAVKAYRDAVLSFPTEDESTGEVRYELWARNLDDIERHVGVPFSAFPAFIGESMRPPRLPLLSNQASPADLLRAVLELLHERRNRYLLQRDLDRADAGDQEASDRIFDTLRDYQELRRGKLPGRVLGKPDHWILLRIGLRMGLGELTAEELARCFDDLCPCGTDAHSADALKRLRTDMIRELGPIEPYQSAYDGLLIELAANEQAQAGVDSPDCPEPDLNPKSPVEN